MIGDILGVIYVAGAVNFLSREICDVFNKVNDGLKSRDTTQAKNKVGASNVVTCNIPQVTFDQPDLTGTSLIYSLITRLDSGYQLHYYHGQIRCIGNTF